MKRTATVRWGKVMTWVLLSAAGAGMLSVLAIMWPQWTQARPEQRGEKPIAEAAIKLRRLDEKTIAVPAEVLRVLDVRTSEVPSQKSNRVRTLPPLTGCLAL